MATLDGLVIENVKERLFTPERLTKILESLFERQRVKNRAIEDRRAALAAEFSTPTKSSTGSIVQLRMAPSILTLS
jgi:hypothetical protein